MVDDLISLSGIMICYSNAMFCREVERGKALAIFVGFYVCKVHEKMN